MDIFFPVGSNLSYSVMEEIVSETRLLTVPGPLPCESDSLLLETLSELSDSLEELSLSSVSLFFLFRFFPFFLLENGICRESAGRLLGPPYWILSESSHSASDISAACILTLSACIRGNNRPEYYENIRAIIVRIPSLIS